MAESVPSLLSPLLSAGALDRLRQAGEAFRTAQPFPHAVLDGLFDVHTLREVAAAYPDGEDPSWFRFRDPSRELKLSLDREAAFPAPVRALVQALNSAECLEILSGVTGIPGLVSDPYFYGGGMHQIMPGGKLAIHADFNLHPVSGLHRRINMLLYLNEGWEDAWGGHLELWDQGVTRCEHRLAPIFNRLVIFRTDCQSYHGHPDPLACPEGRARRSIALYYYSATPASDRHVGAVRSTDFQERPGETFLEPPFRERLAGAAMMVREAGKLVVPQRWKRALRRLRGLARPGDPQR